MWARSVGLGGVARAWSSCINMPLVSAGEAGGDNGRTRVRATRPG